MLGSRCHASLGSRRAADDMQAACSRLRVVSRQLVARALPPGVPSSSPSAYVPPAQQGRQLRLQTVASAEIPVKPYQPPAGGFRVHRITGDGSCMFRAISQGLQCATKGMPMSVQSETIAASNLRAAVVQELQNRKSEMEPFIVGITDDWDEYCRRMADPGVWGGEPEMLMATHVIRRPITVYRPVGRSVEPIVTYGEDLLAKHPPINLLWSGAHYDLLIAAAPDQAAPAA